MYKPSKRQKRTIRGWKKNRVANMNIAICDDDVRTGTLIESIILENSPRGGGLSFAYSCEVFTSGESLLRYLDSNQTKFQIYVLDIKMSGMSGLDVAAKIRENDLDATTTSPLIAPGNSTSFVWSGSFATTDGMVLSSSPMEYGAVMYAVGFSGS